MSGFLYYIPGAQSLATPLPTLVHIGKTLAQAPVFANGPDGGGGLLLVRGGARAPRALMDAAAQEWTEAPGAGFWIGVEKGAAPGPFDLVREELVGGHFVTLADGNQWLVPCARSDVRQIDLPSALRLGQNGEWVSAVLPQFLAFCERTEAAYQCFLAMMSAQREYRAEAQTIPDGDLLALAIEGLAVNYHVSAQEVSLLGLLTTQNVHSILAALFDWPTVEALSARMEAAMSADEKKTSIATRELPESGAGVGE